MGFVTRAFSLPFLAVAFWVLLPHDAQGQVMEDADTDLSCPSGIRDSAHPVSLSADGTTAIIGAPGVGSDDGGVCIWTSSGGVWTQQGPKLIGAPGPKRLISIGDLNLDLNASSNQGAAVALSADGNTALVGGKSADDGAVWVWTRSGGVWTQQGPKLVGQGVAEEGPAYLGMAVALSADGNTALVGGSGDDNEAGAAWIFTRTRGVWNQQGSKLVGTGAFKKSSQGFGGMQGASVALSADGNTGPDRRV